MNKHKVATLVEGKSTDYGTRIYYDVYMHEPASDGDTDLFDLVEWMEVPYDPETGVSLEHTGDAYRVEAANVRDAIEVALSHELFDSKKGF